jgi:glycosyltransferase involved in cell wall biosynthesis
MARLLVLGYELPLLAQGAIEARSYRTWQFVEAALHAGHEVCLIVSHTHDETNVQHTLDNRLGYHRLNMRKRDWVQRLNTIHDAFQPNGILGVMFNSCLRATRIRTTRPVWMDIYGDRLAETQLAEHAVGHNRGHANIMHYTRIVLRSGDVYSTCGTPQKYALVGQLAMENRLNRDNTGYELVYPVLPGASQSKVQVPAEALAVRGKLVPHDAFIVLWAGGYNVWIDPNTLFMALDEAMHAHPNLYFVSVGASTITEADNPYERFCAHIAESAHRDRYVLLGRQPASAIPAYYQAADVGITLDAFHYETLLGTRTRLIEMMGYGLPVITTIGCELSEIIRDHELGLTFPVGDAATFRDHILQMARDANLRQQMADRAREYATTHLSFSETTRAFLDWANAPYHAPDRVRQHGQLTLQNIEYFLRHVVRVALWHGLALESGE